MTVVRKCDSHHGGVKGMSVDGEVCWSWGDVRVCGKV